MELHGMYLLALQDKDKKRARRLVEKQKEMARCFEMGRYYEISSGLELAAAEKDTAEASGEAAAETDQSTQQ